MINSSDFIKRLEKILSYYGITATALAEKIEFNRSAISHLLSGRNKPSLEFVLKLIQNFPEVKMDWLLFGKGTFPASEEEKKIENKDQQQALERGISNMSDLFSNLESGSPVVPVSAKKEGATIEKIILLYKDGSFNVYQN
jgi:plasmid maintenance system antidote protein VapI